MRPPIRSFGSDGFVPFSIVEGDDDHPASVRRELWFDQDIDGRWLVWVTVSTGAELTRDGSGQTGAIVVRNQDVSAFIELLGKLIADPRGFHHEPVFTGADGVPSDRR